MATGRVGIGWALAALLAGAWLAAPVAAQSVPEGQSCGGLLCDMGVFGHKTGPATAAKVNDPPPPLVRAGTSAPQPSAAKAPATAGIATPVVRRKRRVARAAPKEPTPAATRKAVAAQPTATVVAEPRRQAGVPPAATPRPAASPAAAAPPPASERTVVLNPFSQPDASSLGFRPLY